MLTREMVRLEVPALLSPEDVIRYSGKILVEAGKVEEQYVNEMIESYRKLGPYMVMAPGLAMPHARPGGKGTVHQLCQTERTGEFPASVQ